MLFVCRITSWKRVWPGWTRKQLKSHSTGCQLYSLSWRPVTSHQRRPIRWPLEKELWGWTVNGVVRDLLINKMCLMWRVTWQWSWQWEWSHSEIMFCTCEAKTFFSDKLLSNVYAMSALTPLQPLKARQSFLASLKLPVDVLLTWWSWVMGVNVERKDNVACLNFYLVQTY